MPKLKDFGLYFITDGNLTKKSVIEDVKSAIKGGVKIIQYREKDASTKKMMEGAREIKQLCEKNNVVFLVNDRIDIALAADADGVHLGNDDLPYSTARKLLGKNKIIGLSAGSAEQALRNENLGADYTGIGPIYFTTTKKIGKPIGLASINQLKNKIKIPFVSIGGISDANIDSVLKAGAKNIAIISAILTKDDVEQAVKKFINKIKSYR